MRSSRLAAAMVIVAIASADLSTQSNTAGATFDVVSIKRNTSGGFGNQERPDGGVTLINVPVGTLIARAYRLEVAGLPDWAANERFDVIATANRKSATREEQDAMLRSMLADRFKLLAHIEEREYDTYDLVHAREDRRLGSGLKRIDADCAALQGERDAARNAALAAGLPPPELPRPGPTGPLPPCFLRIASGRMDGQATLDSLALALRLTTRPREVVNKTGLSGSYQIAMDFDPSPTQSAPQVTPGAPDGKPSLFTALPEQLGLKLVPSRTARPTVVVDRLERPTEN